MPVPARPPITPAEQFVDPGHLTIRSGRDDDVHVISLYGELDLATADDLGAELERAEASDAASIVVDLSGLEFIDSSGLQLLFLADRRSRTNGARLMLLPPRGEVRRAFAISGLDRLMSFSD